MRDNPRSTVLSALAGVVLLGGVVAFTVGLNAADDGSEIENASSGSGGTSGSATAGEPAPYELPDELANGMVAVDLGTLPADLTADLGDVTKLPEQEDAVAEGLARVFGVPGQFRVYAAEDASGLANITVLDKEPGLFIPDALPVDPAVLGVARAASELVDVDGATCSVTWGAEVPAGQPIPETPPQALRCQYGVDGRTFEVTAQGLTVDDAVEVLKGLGTGQ